MMKFNSSSIVFTSFLCLLTLFQNFIILNVVLKGEEEMVKVGKRGLKYIRMARF
jgi:hypothetical protein